MKWQQNIQLLPLHDQDKQEKLHFVNLFFQITVMFLWKRQMFWNLLKKIHLFFEQYNKNVIFDEIQNVSELFLQNL